MIVVVESTPNPRTRKFLPGKHLSSVPHEFSRGRQGGDALVQAIFALANVKTVLVSEDAISVTIEDESAWDETVPSLRETIATLFSPDFMADAGGAAPEAAVDFDETDAAVVDTIRELIDTRIRPAVAGDGGDIVFRSYRNGVLGLEMRGACSGCPSSSATLKHGIQNLMRYFVPEVTEVVSI
jgi:Fe-S cluster biogenesis protein NfuA